MRASIPLKLTGRETKPELPALLQPALRSVGQPEDPFLPSGYLRATRTFDVGAPARAADGGAAEKTHQVRVDEVVMLELADGSTFITSTERLRDSLRQSNPDLLGPDDEILLEKLREEGAAPRGAFLPAAGGLIRKVFVFVVGEKDPIIDAAAGELADRGVAAALSGVSWAGTKALMWAIEERLDQAPGLFRWDAAAGRKAALHAVDLVNQPPKDRILVFVHGTGSSTAGSFADLKGDGESWAALERHYPGGIYAFEHRTLSAGPIDNAIQLASALPAGARVSFVSHSRGGLVTDLMCLDSLPADLIERYAFGFEGTGDPDEQRAQQVISQLKDAHAEQRKQLGELARLLSDKKLVVERYVRTACPANGTKLASGNFDLFLSGLLTLIGAVPGLFGSPYYSAFKRVVIEIARNRTDPHLVPGIEAMLPDSPMARLLRDAPAPKGIQMAVIAGDLEGGNMLTRLGVLLTDFLLFENTDNDLVVDTKAMLAGIAATVDARVLFDRGSDVSHFRYFANLDTRVALRSWLLSEAPRELDLFQALPTPEEYEAAIAQAATRDATAADRPVVVVLPGVMGSHLRVNGKDRVWLEPHDIALGGLDKIMWGKPGIEAEQVFAMSYGGLCEALSKSHRVEPFPYDWRQPLDVLAERLGEFLDRLLKQTDKPVRLLAHSMGGLVVRACIHKRRAVMDALMAREGARLVMCGTPNQGAHSMVENMLGKGDTLRMLVRLDLKHDMQEILDIVAGFRGALQLLPKPGFTDTFQGQPDGGERFDYDKSETWIGLRGKAHDFWFGNGKCAQPGQAVLNEASWLWRTDGLGTPSLPAEYEKNSIYVFGVAANTPCGVRETGGRLKMVGTTRGDGTVTWDSGRINGIGAFYWMQARHGDLLGTKEHFSGLIDLLASGATNQLLRTPPAVRAIEQPVPVVYDAGPPTIDDPSTIARAVVGGSLSGRIPARSKRRLEVAVRAMDLRFVGEPIMVGHYEQDPIAGPEALIDREVLNGDLSERHSLGLYAGPRGTAVVVLRVPNSYQGLRGAVVTGLGAYDGTLSASDLTEAVRTGVLRYLLQIVDVLGKSAREVSLSTVLLGYNSSANLTIPAAAEALVRGVLEANARFHDTTRLDIHVARLNIIELYLDTALTAVYALRQLSQRLSGAADHLRTKLTIRGELDQGDGARQRLLDNRGGTYWPRVIVTDADRELGSDRGRDDRAVPSAAGEPTQLANRLRFLYVGQRARAESVIQQRQPGLIEKLVRQQIHSAVWQDDLGRMLFQLMVPHDFKDVARQLERIILVVDGYTANLPWELMLADDPSRPDEDKRPLAVRAAVVRQLASGRFRRHVRPGVYRNALVVGNPSVTGFGTNFIGPSDEALQDPPNLEGAERETEMVRTVLTGMDYDVTPVIGSDRPASDVLAALYRKPYRIVHISAHGVFNLKHRDGSARSGVVLSDGMLITAAEIQAMETVPELVFLNCCHLAKVDIGREGNKLAASISRELIEIGVRCVVVAGWAVTDDIASLFGQTFYQALLQQRQTFGAAVFAARGAAWERSRSDITWGAFQAYGDAGWRAERPVDAAAASSTDEPYASLSEVLDELASIRANVARRLDRQSLRDARAQAKVIEHMLKRRCPPSWLLLPQLQSALGEAWRDLGEFEKARESFLAAVQAENGLSNAPIRDIEQLANVEARLGEWREDPALIMGAIGRLESLARSVAADSAFGTEAPRNVERAALRGSAHKRMASLAARLLLTHELDAPQRADTTGILLDSLSASANAYGSAEGTPGSSGFSTYLALNRLSLEALLGFSTDALRKDALALAEQCRQATANNYRRTGNVWDAVMQADSILVVMLLNGTLARVDPDGEDAFDELMRAYDEILGAVLAKPSQIDSIVTQLELLSRFADALSLAQKTPPLQRVADRLLQLARHLRPSRSERVDRPEAAAAAPLAQKARSPQATRQPVGKRATRKRKA